MREPKKIKWLVLPRMAVILRSIAFGHTAYFEMDFTPSIGLITGDVYGFRHRKNQRVSDIGIWFKLVDFFIWECGGCRVKIERIPTPPIGKLSAK